MLLAMQWCNNVFELFKYTLYSFNMFYFIFKMGRCKCFTLYFLHILHSFVCKVFLSFFLSSFLEYVSYWDSSH